MVLNSKKLKEDLLSEMVMKQALIEANQLKRDFLDKITHELRTPIHAILSFSKFGINNITPEKNESYFQNINQSGRWFIVLQ